MGLGESMPTRQQLYDFARLNLGSTMTTLHESRPFQFVVDGERLRFVPSSGKPRTVDSDNVDVLLKKLELTRSLKPSEYQGDSHNASYLLPLVLAWQAGGIEPYAGAEARSRLGTLTDSQRGELFERVSKAVGYRLSAKPADGRVEHGFEMYLKATKTWVGTVYWSDNFIGNDVEIAFNLPHLAYSDQERLRVKGWFDATASALHGRRARNHSGGEESWYRIGFSFDAALKFFDSLRPNLEGMTRDRDRWSAPASPQIAAQPFDGPLTKPPAGEKIAAADDEPVSHDPDSEHATSPELQASTSLAATITLMLDHAQKASDQSGHERTAVYKQKHQRFADDDAFRQYVEALLARQHGRCKITGLELQFLGQHDDDERIASLDRIDSDGHYEIGNLQVVCRFVNRWKRDDKDQDFRRLMDLLKTAWKEE